MHPTVPRSHLRPGDGGCPTGKVAYRTYIAALMGVARLRSRGRPERRVYDCPHCDRWHLTTHPYRWRRNEWIDGLS